jgi:imidazolonepropionase-like amidohydrolase
MRAAQRKQKRKHNRKAAAAPARKARSSRASPLKATRDATRTQERQRKTRLRLRGRANGSVVLTPVAAGIGLMTNRAQAFLELPGRLAKCRSPIELWREQTRFVQEGFTEYARYLVISFRHPQAPVTR